MIKEISRVKKIYQSDEGFLETRYTGSKIKIVPSNENISVLKDKYLFGYYYEGLFYADTNKLCQYGLYDKGKFLPFHNSMVDEKNKSKNIFGFLYKGIFYVQKTPPEYAYPSKYEFGYTTNGLFYSLQKFQDNYYDLSQTIPKRRYPRSKICVSDTGDGKIIDPSKYTI